MGVEIEVKVLDIDPAEMARLLEALGAVAEGRIRLVTAVYDFPDRRLLAGGAYVRVRRSGSGRVQVAYKGGGRADRGYKEKEEIEFEAGDFEVACEFLSAIGLERVSWLEKDRTIYRWGEIEYSIDEWPHIPAYLEVEAPTIDLVDRGLAALGIPRERASTMGPRELFRHYGFDLEAMPEVTFQPGA